MTMLSLTNCTTKIHVVKVPPSHHLDILLPHEVTSCESLSHADQSKQLFISHLLKDSQETSFEEHLNAVLQTL